MQSQRESTVCELCAASGDARHGGSVVCSVVATLARRVAAAVYTLRERTGQGTVEYAVVFAALLAMIVGFGALWRLFDGGTVVMHAVQSASHHVQSAAAGAIGDVFQY